MEDKPLISVLITTRNRASYLKETIENVLLQTYNNIQVLVMDDSSSDNTFQVIADFSKSDKRIKGFENQTNLGVADSLNKGIALARGEYIAIIDDDDLWIDGEKLKKQITFLSQRKEYALVGGGAVWHDEKGRELLRYLLPEDDEEIRSRILMDNCFVHSAVMFRKRDFEKTGGYRKQFGVGCDWALFLELGRLGKFYNFPGYFVDHLQWSKNISRVNVRRIIKDDMKIRRAYGKYYPRRIASLMLGAALYLGSWIPHRAGLTLPLLKLRSVFFGNPPHADR